jgi:hypothetical protein
MSANESKTDKPVVVSIPIYALPGGTDAETLEEDARTLAQALEEMGVFGQRDVEPCHFFRFPDPVQIKGNTK